MQIRFPNWQNIPQETSWTSCCPGVEKVRQLLNAVSLSLDWEAMAADHKEARGEGGVHVLAGMQDQAHGQPPLLHTQGDPSPARGAQPGSATRLKRVPSGSRHFWETGDTGLMDRRKRADASQTVTPPWPA